MLDERLWEASQILTEMGACFHDSRDRFHACEVLARALDRARLEGRTESLRYRRSRSQANLRVLKHVEPTF